MTTEETPGDRSEVYQPQQPDTLCFMWDAFLADKVVEHLLHAALPQPGKGQVPL